MLHLELIWGTPSRKVPQTLTSATSKWGLNGEELSALLRVRTGPECPKGNRRELMQDSNLNCCCSNKRGSKRERINLGKALNLGTTCPFPEGKTERIPEKS